MAAEPDREDLAERVAERVAELAKLDHDDWLAEIERACKAKAEQASPEPWQHPQPPGRP